MTTPCITIDTRVRWATPCFRDTGITVGRVIHLWRAGWSDEAVLDDLPQLTGADLDAARDWHERYGDAGLGPRPPDPGNRYPRIAVDPAVQGGYPTIRGTRIPVDVIVGFRRHGFAVDEILDEYPALTADDVTEALRYAGEVVPS